MTPLKSCRKSKSSAGFGLGAQIFLGLLFLLFGPLELSHGQSGYGLYFGSGGSLSVQSPVNEAVKELTVACRVRLMGKNKNKPALIHCWEKTKKNSVKGSFALSLGAANRVSFSILTTTGDVFTVGGGSWKDRLWHHIIATMGNGELRLFLDGVQIGETEYPKDASLASSSIPLTIGHGSQVLKKKNSVLDGFIDEVLICKAKKTLADLGAESVAAIAKRSKDIVLAISLRPSSRAATLNSVVGPDAHLSLTLQRCGYGTTPTWETMSKSDKKLSLQTYDLSIGQAPSDIPQFGRNSNAFLVTNRKAKQVGLVWKNPKGDARLTWINPALSQQVTHQLPSFDDSTLMAACSDKNGTIYYVLMSNKMAATGKKLEAAIYKTGADGVLIKKRTLDTSANALNASSLGGWHGNMRLSKSVLGLMLPRRMHVASDGLRHQGAIAVTLSAKSLDVLRNLGQTSGHSNGNMMTLGRGGDFIALDLGDNYPRGVHLHRFTKSNRESGVIFTFKTEHGTSPRNSKKVYEEISGNGRTFYKWSNDNATYTELGGVIEGKKQYSVIVSTDRNTKGRVLDSSRAFRNCPDPRDLVMFRVKKNFGRGSSVQSEISDKIMVGKIDKKLVETGGFYDFAGRWKKQRITGMHWLTNYGSGETAHAPQLVPLSKGRVRLIWELDSPSEPHQSTWTMVVDEKAKVVEPASNLGVILRPNPRDQTVQIGKRVFLLASIDGRNSSRPVLCHFLVD